MKRSVYFFLFVILFACQGCFEIVEQLVLKKDGSGSFQLVLNLSKSRTKINSFISTGIINGHKIPSKPDIRQHITELESTAKKIQGISAVSSSVDFDNYIASFNLNFTNIHQLNELINKVRGKNKEVACAPIRLFNYDAASAVFTRSGDISLKDYYIKMSNADREIFSEAGYTSVYKFDRAVQSMTNKKAVLSASKKAVMLKLNAFDIITNTSSIETNIQLAKH